MAILQRPTAIGLLLCEQVIFDQDNRKPPLWQGLLTVPRPPTAGLPIRLIVWRPPVGRGGPVRRPGHNETVFRIKTE